MHAVESFVLLIPFMVHSHESSWCSWCRSRAAALANCTPPKRPRDSPLLRPNLGQPQASTGAGEARSDVFWNCDCVGQLQNRKSRNPENRRKLSQKMEFSFFLPIFLLFLPNFSNFLPISYSPEWGVFSSVAGRRHRTSGISIPDAAKLNSSRANLQSDNQHCAIVYEKMHCRETRTGAKNWPKYWGDFAANLS